MAVNQTASNEQTIRRSAASRRLYFGTNVGVMVCLALLVLIGLNLLAHARNTRWDLTGGIAGYRVSDRTKHVLDLVDSDTPIRITTVYASTDPNMRRDEYFPRVRDLSAELRQHRRSIEVAHLVTADDQARLRDRLQSEFGGAAGEYHSVVNDGLTAWSDLVSRLTPYRQELLELVTVDAWIGQFSTVANILALLQQDQQGIEDTRREVDDLIRGAGIPRFTEANSKIRELNNDLHRHLGQIESWTAEMAKLVEVLADPESPFVQMTHERLPGMVAQATRLVTIAGSPTDPDVPEDPKPLLRDFARACIELSDLLVAESRRVNSFVQQHPALRQHPRWQIQRGMFVMELSALLEGTAEELGTNGRTLRGYLQRQNVALDQFQNLVRQVRQFAVTTVQTIEQWQTGITAILNEGARIDPGSRDFLENAFTRHGLDEAMDRINQISTQITELPELRLDEIATRLGEDNIIVVEVGHEVRVIPFDDAWPIADPMARQFGAEEGAPPRRIFDGDSAISNAVLEMVSEQPVAQVILVTFEEVVPPEAQQFRRPMTGPMPVQSLATLRDRLTAMHFKVDEWNLADDAARDNRPAAIDGVPAIYVFLPTPQPPSPLMRQQGGRQFTAEDGRIAREVLADGGRGLFLAAWQPAMPMAPGPEYGWAPILKEDWGIEVHTDRRVIRGGVDRRHPGRYTIDLVQWWYMQLNNFREHPIGEPLRARRMLIKDVCPVSRADVKPENVELTAVLTVPEDATDIWAGTEREIQRIFEALQSAQEGSFTRGPETWGPPFEVILAGRNTGTDGRVVVMGNGLSLRDDYLQQRVIRLGGGGTQLMTDPAPTENVDLVANALYWLADRNDLIAAGPAQVPVVEAIEGGSRRSVWVLSMTWALAALMAGGIVMVVRRK